MSGLLPFIFSAGDGLKRRVRGLLSDPMGEVEQRVGLLNDKAGAFNQLHAQATDEAVASLREGGTGWGPKSQELAGLLAESYNPIGMVKLPFGQIPENADDLAALAGKPWFTPDAALKKKVMSAEAAKKKTAEALDSHAKYMFGRQGVSKFDDATDNQKKRILQVAKQFNEFETVPVDAQKKQFLKEVLKTHKAPISAAHKQTQIDFDSIPISSFDDGLLIHKSPNYNKRQSSEYRLIVGEDGVPAYARKSNHWGRFTTNIKEGSEQAKVLGLTNEHNDPFGRVGYNVHKWDLVGGDASKKTSQAGAFSLADLLENYFKAQ